MIKEIDIKLYGKQHQIFKDWMHSNKHCMTIVPVGSGKSFLATLFLPIAAQDNKFHMGRDVIYSAPTLQMAKTIIWPALKESCMNYFGLKHDAFNNGELTVKFPAGNYIRIKSAEQRLNLRGINSSIWVLDEAAIYSEEVLHEISNRTRPAVGQKDSAGRMIIITTPHGNGPLYNMYLNAKENPDKWIVHHYNYEEMASGNLEFIMEQKKLLSKMKFNQDFNCSFEQVEDQFFYEFNKNLHTGITQDDGGDLYSFHDFNKRISCAVIAKVKNPYTDNGIIEIIKSYTIDNCGTEQMAQAIREDFPQRRIYSVIDVSGSHVNRDTTSPFGVTDKTLLEKYGFTIINNKKANPLISDTDNSSNAFIKNSRLKININDTRLIQAMQTYHYEDGSRKKLVKYMDKNAYIDGLGDCLRYGIHHLFPIKHQSSGNNYVTSDNSNYIRPGTEYMPYSPIFPGGPTMEELFKKSNNNDTMQY